MDLGPSRLIAMRATPRTVALAVTRSAQSQSHAFVQQSNSRFTGSPPVKTINPESTPVTSVTGVHGAERYTHEREGHDRPPRFAWHDLLHSLFCGLGIDRRFRTEVP